MVEPHRVPVVVSDLVVDVVFLKIGSLILADTDEMEEKNVPLPL